MRIAVLPLNAAAGARHSLARQYAQFAAEIARRESGQEVDALSASAQFQEDGIVRNVMVNPSEDHNDDQTLTQYFSQADVSDAMDGLLIETPDRSGSIEYRFFKGGNSTPVETHKIEFTPDSILSALRKMTTDLTHQAGGSMASELANDEDIFGTKSPTAFVEFLEGRDDLQYIERSGGKVTRDFNPEPAINHFLAALKADSAWDGPRLALLHLIRLCTMFRIGNADLLANGLNQVLEMTPEDPAVWFALGELFMEIENFGNATDAYEKAHRYAPEEPVILSRLGISQLRMGMPANAERNLRKAIDLEGDDKPSLDILSSVLAGTNRAHEIPDLWKEQIARMPQDPESRAKYAMSLINTGRKDDGIRAFDDALEVLEDNAQLKRFYAPVLVNEKDFDRAMDFYEDYLDENPTDVAAMVEYAQTLQQADREFEIPGVLKNILASNPDPNTRAQTQAWLIEIEQPKRAEAVQSALQKVENGDFEGALRELKPLRQWLADYWMLWRVMAAAQNQLGQYADAEQSARKLREIFPACEPAYVELNNALGSQGKNDEAYQIMQIAMANMSQSVPIAISFGLAAKRVGQDDTARQIARSLREAFGTQPDLEAVLAELER